VNPPCCTQIDDISPAPHQRSSRKLTAAIPELWRNYGEHVGNHRTAFGGGQTRYKGEPDTMTRGYQNPVRPTNMALSGPGAGREVMRSGGQGTHGSTNPGNPRPNPRRELEGE